MLFDKFSNFVSLVRQLTKVLPSIIFSDFDGRLHCFIILVHKKHYKVLIFIRNHDTSIIKKIFIEDEMQKIVCIKE